MENNNHSFKVLALKEFVPNWLHFWPFIFFAVIFQLSEGIYLALTRQMVGSLALKQEDVMMAGYASLVGMTMIFPILFRLKARFTSKTILLTNSVGIIVCNLITMNTMSMPILVCVCFIAGVFKLWSTFECVSSIQLKITPKWDFAVFLPIMFLIVLGSIQLSGILGGYLAYYLNWKCMQYLIIGLMLLIALFAMTLLRHYRSTPKQSLDNIDWLGGILWSLFLLLIIFVLEYGEHYDWLDSKYIRFSIIAMLLILSVNVWRAKTIKHPYIQLKSFTFMHIDTLLLLFALMCILLSTPNILQNSYTGEILHYDVLQTLSLNWSVFLGIIAGAYFSYVAFVKLHWGYKLMTNIGFSLILAYLVIFYFIIAPTTSKEMMFVPLFFRGAGNIIIYVTLTVYAGRTIPFTHFFQVLAILGFVRTGFGSSLGTAIFGRLFSTTMNKNIMSLSLEIDKQNPIVNTIPFASIMEVLHKQALLVTIKEMYGYAILAGIIILLLSLCTRYKNILKFKMPRWE
jgi:MFS transporter, DHA2 family, multidrug resistance protein